MAYSHAVVTAYLREIGSSNLTPGAKTMARQMIADVVALQDKVKDLEAQAAKQRDQRINSTVNQPSSKKPEWDKDKGPKAKPKKTKKPKRGRKLGGKRMGAGNRSKENLTPDEHVHNELETCPNCGEDLSEQEVVDTRKRIVEDTPAPPEKTIVTEETSEKKWCPTCKKIVSAASELALKGADFGLNATILAVYLWVVPAMSLPSIKTYLERFMSLAISASGLSKLIIRVAKILTPVADEILQDVRSNFKLHADETGWRVRGKTWWLWAFANESSAYYHAAPSRGSAVVQAVIGDAYWGVLIADAYGGYNLLDYLLRQTCMAHIFRRIRTVIRDRPSARTLLTFHSKLKRIIKDGERLAATRKEIGEATFWIRFDMLKARLADLLNWKNPNPDLAKIIASIRRVQGRVLTFVILRDCPSHNNFAEYIIRKGVLKRKVSGGSMSARGAQAYAILISIAQTCHLRGLCFRKFLAASLRQYMKTGKPMLLSEYAASLETTKTQAMAA